MQHGAQTPREASLVVCLTSRLRSGQVFQPEDPKNKQCLGHPRKGFHQSAHKGKHDGLCTGPGAEVLRSPGRDDQGGLALSTCQGVLVLAVPLAGRHNTEQGAKPFALDPQLQHRAIHWLCLGLLLVHPENTVDKGSGRNQATDAECGHPSRPRHGSSEPVAVSTCAANTELSSFPAICAALSHPMALMLIAGAQDSLALWS